MGYKGATIKKAIHLLYVPTIFCNMGCQYCYLGKLTDEPIDLKKSVDTLQFAIDKFLENGYLPFNISFHGGEVTTLPTKYLEELFKITKNYYSKHKDRINSMGFSVNPIHIKTNLFNIKKHYDILLKYKVSISGSVDLPLRLHKKYRVDKNGNSTLETILENLKLLTQYPYNKKISCVVTKEHLESIDEFIEDIKYLHYELKFDMTKFNIMFSFDSNTNIDKFEKKIDGTEMLSDDEQVIFYKKIYNEFIGSDLESGLKEHWFKEFTPEFCCSSVNCGDKFFLLQSDGEVYSCPRGQASRDYYYGNIFKDDIQTIIDNGWKRIERNENSLDISSDCLECEYFPYCNLGCPFVRSETKSDKSYTCKLQKEIYKDNPQKYKPYDKEYLKEHIKRFLYLNKIDKIKDSSDNRRKDVNITKELFNNKNSLKNIIEQDEVLKHIYSNEIFFIELDGKRYMLDSQILKNINHILVVNNNSKIILGVKDNIFSLAIAKNDEPSNYIYMMALNSNMVRYGDEDRTKQEHLYDYSIYKNSFIKNAIHIDGYYKYDISDIIKMHCNLYDSSVKNNIFFTTKALREYHYSKHKKNAFYHIQALNLPFPNIEFYYVNEDS